MFQKDLLSRFQLYDSNKILDVTIMILTWKFIYFIY